MRRETETFVGFQRFSTHVAARFRRSDLLIYDDGPAEFLMDRKSTEARLRNLEADGVDCPATRAALASWQADDPGALCC